MVDLPGMNPNWFWVTFVTLPSHIQIPSNLSKSNNKYTIARLGYADEDKTTVLELTYSYGISEYDHGNAYSQVVIATDSVHKSAEAVERMVKLLGGKVLQQPGSAPGSRITSFLDPDKWKVVLVDQADLIEEL
ncbi:unnamed protein product [Urochloa humidicola]